MTDIKPRLLDQVSEKSARWHERWHRKEKSPSQRVRAFLIGSDVAACA
ncbi:MAG TPA: hypothetical protein VF427_13070 [Noviherbaspirillum sp.]